MYNGYQFRAWNDLIHSASSELLCLWETHDEVAFVHAVSI